MTEGSLLGRLDRLSEQQRDIPENIIPLSGVVRALAEMGEDTEIVGSERLTPLEQDLNTVFNEAVDRINLENIAVIEPHRKKMRQLPNFSLQPVRVKETGFPNTLKFGGYGVPVDPTIRVRYGQEGHAPYLDTPMAVGLVHKDTLAAIAGAGIDTKTNSLRITQLQAVNTAHDPTDPKAKYKTGLHSGLMWRDTLVQAWKEIAADIGIQQIEIQSWLDNDWLYVEDSNSDPERPKEEDPLYLSYDAVAQRMGFTEDPTTKHWIHKI